MLSDLTAARATLLNGAPELVLRDDQADGLSAIRQAILEGIRRILLQGATGSGKGTVAAVALAKAETNNCPSVFVCHRTEINQDLSERLRAAGASSLRFISGDHTEGDEDAAVTVLSMQTADARDLCLPNARLWWVDEAHRMAAASYQRLADRHPKAIWVGATATPARPDGRPLKFFERIIQGPQIGWLVARALLAPVRVLAPDTTLDALADDPATLYPHDTPGLVFCHSVEHSREVAAQLQARGHRCRHVDGGTAGRYDLINDFNAGRLDVLCCYRLLTEGVDTRRARVVMLATVMQSVIAYLQSIGRGRRPHGGVTTVYDLMGSMWLHGHPDAERVYSLDGAHGIVTSATSAISQPVQCRACLGWALPAPRCPQCGHRLPAPKPPKITKKELRERRLAATPHKGAAWDLWSELVLKQRAHPLWKPQAAAIQFKTKTGQWPRWSLRCVPEAPEPSETTQSEEASSHGA